jgi:FMN phosphatase YigB (HAD superfamily)
MPRFDLVAFDLYGTLLDISGLDRPGRRPARHRAESPRHFTLGSGPLL